MNVDSLRIFMHIASIQPMARAVLYLILVSLTSAHMLLCEHQQISFSVDIGSPVVRAARNFQIDGQVSTAPHAVFQWTVHGCTDVKRKQPKPLQWNGMLLMDLSEMWDFKCFRFCSYSVLVGLFPSLTSSISIPGKNWIVELDFKISSHSSHSIVECW